MQILYVTAKAEEGKVVIDVPESLNGKELEITVSEKAEKVLKFSELPVEERLKILKQYEGKALFPDTEINKYDVYDQ